MGLVDHSIRVERTAQARRLRADLSKAFGDFIAGLAPWSWFATITFRGDAPTRDAALEAILEWLADLQAAAGGRPIGWTIAEEFGRIGGRWHCHFLVSGVSHLHRRFWWAEAFRRFGRTEIRPFDPEQAAAFYTAKYAAKALGELHFGGTLAGCKLDRMLHTQDGRRSWEQTLVNSSEPLATHAIIAPSADLERQFFRLGLRRWHR